MACARSWQHAASNQGEEMTSHQATKAATMLQTLFLPLLTSALLLSSPAAHAGWDEGVAAHEAKNYALALQEFRPLAEQGDRRAQRALGVMYRLGQGVAKDDRVAVTWYRKAADQGLANAQYTLGLMLANGQGVAKDERAAVTWYRKAAEQGDFGAQFELGLMLDTGRGVAKDEREAASWYRKAA